MDEDEIKAWDSYAGHALEGLVGRDRGLAGGVDFSAGARFAAAYADALLAERRSRTIAAREAEARRVKNQKPPEQPPLASSF
jgi:hypothetical protein